MLQVPGRGARMQYIPTGHEPIAPMHFSGDWQSVS
jgi:hypothetical protein